MKKVLKKVVYVDGYVEMNDVVKEIFCWSEYSFYCKVVIEYDVFEWKLSISCKVDKKDEELLLGFFEKIKYCKGVINYSEDNYLVERNKRNIWLSEYDEVMKIK
jgi:hypothetical protein